MITDNNQNAEFQATQRTTSELDQLAADANRFPDIFDSWLPPAKIL